MIRRHLLNALLALVTARALGFATRLFDWLAEVQYARAWGRAFKAGPARHRLPTSQIGPVRIGRYAVALAATSDTAESIGAA